MRRFGLEYIQRLLESSDYMDLVQLSGIVCASSKFSSTVPDYNLPPPLFVFVETLCWFAQAIRSGVWTYHEATPQPRQEATLKALRDFAPPDFAEQYQRGMAEWKDPEQIQAVDEWIEANDEKYNRWLRDWALQNRDLVVEVTN